MVDQDYRPWLTSVNIDIKARSREEQMVLELVYADLLELVANSKEQLNIKIKTDNLNRIVRRNFDNQKFIDQYVKATELHQASCSGRFVKIFPFVIEEEDLTEQLPVISPHHNIMIINKELSRILSPQNLKQFLHTQNKFAYKPKSLTKNLSPKSIVSAMMHSKGRNDGSEQQSPKSFSRDGDGSHLAFFGDHNLSLQPVPHIEKSKMKTVMQHYIKQPVLSTYKRQSIPDKATMMPNSFVSMATETNVTLKRMKHFQIKKKSHQLNYSRATMPETTRKQTIDAATKSVGKVSQMINELLKDESGLLAGRNSKLTPIRDTNMKNRAHIRSKLESRTVYSQSKQWNSTKRQCYSTKRQSIK